jgi:hypothetical protein
MKTIGRSRQVKVRHTKTRREPLIVAKPKPKPKPKSKPKPKPRNIKMPEKKDTEKGSDLYFPEKDSKEGEQKEPIPVRLVSGQEPEPTAHRRSDTEQAILDTYGDDPSKFKEGTRERDVVEGLPENIAKKREEEEKKKKRDK